MEFKSVERYKESYMPIVEADEGHCLIGGAKIHDGPVFDNYSDALYVMHGWILNNLRAKRSVKSGKVVPFKGMVDCLARVKKEKTEYLF